MVLSGTVQVPPAPLASGTMTGAAVPTGPSWMCASVPSMLLVFTVPLMAPLDVSTVKNALPVATVVTAGVSCAPLSDAVLKTVFAVELFGLSLPQDDTRTLAKNAAAMRKQSARMGTPPHCP